MLLLLLLPGMLLREHMRACHVFVCLVPRLEVQDVCCFWRTSAVGNWAIVWGLRSMSWLQGNHRSGSDILRRFRFCFILSLQGCCVFVALMPCRADAPVSFLGRECVSHRILPS